MPYAVERLGQGGAVLKRDDAPLVRWVKPREVWQAIVALVTWGPDVPMADGDVLHLDEDEYRAVLVALVQIWGEG